MAANRRDFPRQRRTPPSPYPDASLAELGLSEGDVVRFRRLDEERWKQATVERREKDGSIGLRDAKGPHAIPIDRIEVRTTGRRGGMRWEPLTDLAARTEQMRLL